MNFEERKLKKIGIELNLIKEGNFLASAKPGGGMVSTHEENCYCFVNLTTPFSARVSASDPLKFLFRFGLHSTMNSLSQGR